MNAQDTQAAYEAANTLVFTDISPKASRETWTLITRTGRNLGMITKHPNTRTDRNPWKAFLGIGFGQKFLGVSYKNRKDAIDMIVRADAGIFVGTEIARGE